jgi:hypothetical protein
MKSYCKLKSGENQFFECEGFVQQGEIPKAMWCLRPLLSGSSIIITCDDFENNFTPCCPAEALGSLY